MGDPRLALAAALLLAAGCSRDRSVEPGASPASAALSATAAATATPGTSAVPTPSANSPGPIADDEFTDLVVSLSEPGRGFISDNVVSNETSTLQVAAVVQRPHGARGGVYVGVGPEQNYTLMALTRPELAVVVDLRRDNALLHLLHKVHMEHGRTRLHYLARLLGRPLTKPRKDAPPPRLVTIDEVIAELRQRPPRRASFDATLTATIAELQRRFGRFLTEGDATRLRVLARRFFEGQLGTRFVLHRRVRHGGGRRYPTLEDLVSQTSPDGRVGSYLATEGAFQDVRRLHVQNRILPIVGNFAGRHTFPALARVLRQRHLTVRTFYASNVEQYLIADGVWATFQENVARLPVVRDGYLLRAYLDQGQRHPRQLPGQRTATLAQPLGAFIDATPPPSWWALVKGL